MEIKQDKLRIREKDYKVMKGYTIDLLKLYDKGLEDLRELEVHFKRWVSMAKRLRDGESKIREMEEDGTALTNKEMFRLLKDLYEFLLRVFGYFGDVLKSIMQAFGRVDLYYKMQKRVMAHL